MDNKTNTEYFTQIFLSSVNGTDPKMFGLAGINSQIKEFIKTRDIMGYSKTIPISIAINPYIMLGNTLECIVIFKKYTFY